MARRGLRIAVEGCLHGELDAVYGILQEREQREGAKIDLLICCGDFQAVRNPDDLRWMKVPNKYKTMGSFYKYYSGEKVAPFLTLFIGGNHEASNHLLELGYGGWVAPNIYYMGYSGVVWFGGLRIGGISGIFNAQHYNLGHCERIPFEQSMVTSAYHVRSFEVFKLKQLTGDFDIFLSHDWPTEIYHHGNLEQLLRFKPYFRNEAMSNTLGSPAAKELLDYHQPRRWWSGHLHCRFDACYIHQPKGEAASGFLPGRGILGPPPMGGPGMGFPLMGQPPMGGPRMGHPPMGGPRMGHPPMGGPRMGHPPMGGPGMGQPPMGGPGMGQPPMGPPPKVTEFLALDKCLPKRRFLEVFDYPECTAPKVFCYDPEWLAITKAINDIIPLEGTPWNPPTNGTSPRCNFEPTEEELKWIQERFEGDFAIPSNFQMSVPPLRDSQPWQQGSSMVTDNPQTIDFCAKLEIVNKFSCQQARPSFKGRDRYFSHQPPSGWAPQPPREHLQLPPAVAPPSHTASNPDEIDLDDDEDLTDTSSQHSAPLSAIKTLNPEETDITEDDDGDDGDHQLSTMQVQPSDVTVNPDEVSASSVGGKSGKGDGMKEEEDDDDGVKGEEEEEGEDEGEEGEGEEEEGEDDRKEGGEDDGKEGEEEEGEDDGKEGEEEEGSSGETQDTEVEVDVCLVSDEVEEDGMQRLAEKRGSTMETTPMTASSDQSSHSDEEGLEEDMLEPPAKRAK